MNESEDEQPNLQQVIAEMERELDIEAGPEGELIRLREEIEVLGRRHDDLATQVTATGTADARRELVEVDRRLQELINGVNWETERLIEADREQRLHSEHGGDMKVTVYREGWNRWRVQFRTVDRTTGEEQVHEHLLAGWRSRKAIRLIRSIGTEVRRR